MIDLEVPSGDVQCPAAGSVPASPDPLQWPPKVPGPIPWIPTERATGETIPGSGIAPEASLFASCFWCQRIHPGEHPLSVCVDCAARYATLRSLEMSGSFPLDDAAIDDELARRSPGNYALGYMDGDRFMVFYVGRSDSDLRRRLHGWVGMPSRPDEYASSAKASWAVHQRRPNPLHVPALGRVGNAETSYTRFAYSYARSAEEAYAKEWRNYDAFGGSRGLDNQNPPVAAAG